MIEGIDYTLRNFKGDYRFSEFHVRCPVCGAGPMMVCKVIENDRPRLAARTRASRKPHQKRREYRNEVNAWVVSTAMDHVTSVDSQRVGGWNKFVVGYIKQKEVPGSYKFKNVAEQAMRNNLHMVAFLFKWIDHIAKLKLKGELV